MKLFIGCSSSDNIPKKYFDDCSNCLNKLLVHNDIVVGISSTGITKLAYDIAKKYGNKASGVCTTYHSSTFSLVKCDYEFVVSEAILRTKKLIDEADAIIFLPGGIGSVQEIFSAIEAKRSGEFDKPIIFYNSYNFYDKVFQVLDLIYKEHFALEEVKKCYYVTNDIDDLMNYLNNYKKS